MRAADTRKKKKSLDDLHKQFFR